MSEQHAIAIIKARLPLYTDLAAINALKECISSIRSDPVQVKALDELHKLLCAIPNNDRGLSWQLRDAYSGVERLEVHGAIAKAFKYILDNTDAIRSVLVAAPSRDDVVRECIAAVENLEFEGQRTLIEQNLIVEAVAALRAISGDTSNG